MKDILAKTAEGKVNFSHALITKHSVQLSQLLRGLLAIDPAVRLDATDALLLPVFDDFRGSMLPLLEPQPKTYEFEDNFDTFFEDDQVMADIQSLEAKSRVMGVSAGSHAASQFSVRFEGQSPPQMKKMLPSHVSKFHSSKFNGSSQASAMLSGSQVSWKDDISPLTSPQVQLRMIGKQQSGTMVEKRPEGLAQFLASPGKPHSDMLIIKPSDKNAK